MKVDYLELESENDALTTGVKYSPCWIGPGWGGKKNDFRRFSDNCGHGAWIRIRFLPRPSVGCPALVPRSSRGPVSHRQVARDGGAEGLSRGKGRVQAKA